MIHYPTLFHLWEHLARLVLAHRPPSAADRAYVIARIDAITAERARRQPLR